MPRRALCWAVRWATDALTHDDTTVSALARHLGVDWHTCWDAVEIEAKKRVAQPERMKNVKTLGVDEHIWKPSRIGTDRAVTIMVDLTRDATGASTPGSSTLSSADQAPRLEATGTGLLRHWRGLQRWHRSHQPDHREDPPPRPRLPRLRSHRLRILLAASGNRAYRKRA